MPKWLAYCIQALFWPSKERLAAGATAEPSPFPASLKRQRPKFRPPGNFYRSPTIAVECGNGIGDERN